MTTILTSRVAALVLSALLWTAPAFADDAAPITRTAIPNSTFPISQAVRVPAGAETIYLSGMVPTAADPTAPKDSIAAYGDTEAQANSAFARIDQALKAQGLGFGDVVMMHVYLVGDPAKGGKLDFAGFQAAYTKYFGTADQPNKPARSAMQVAALANPGFLVEIEVIAAKAH
jgi:enamine deaminase RidA (YjgF/YER057c/UK114 family)